MSRINTLVEPLHQLISDDNNRTVCQSHNSIVFIDATVEHYQSLIAGVVEGIEVIILNARQDGVQQISQILAQRQGIASIHIVSHGNSGSVQLGTANLSWNTLFYYANQLQNWSRALTETSQILLYGCNVAEGTQGKAFVHRLSELTNATVAASKDLTGSAALGGNWNLELQTGSGAVELAFSSATMEVYEAVLTGPYLVRDINPGSGSSFPMNLTNINGTLYFRANSGSNGYELWRIDNTTGDAVQVANTDPWSNTNNPYSSEVISVNGTFYFASYDEIYGYELSRIDNTTDNAVQVIDINPGSGSSYPG